MTTRESQDGAPIIGGAGGGQDQRNGAAGPGTVEEAGHEPYVSAAQSPAEFTVKAAVAGVLFGIVFGAANAYLGLQAGLTISTSIPVAVMTVAAFRALRRVGLRGSILEANISQTIGSASSSVASGVIFTLPALFMWGMSPALLQMTLLAMCGGLLGVLFMIPLRSFLIVREHHSLPYPEGTACAEVLLAAEKGGAKAKNVFLGLTVGAAVKMLFGWLQAFPGTVKAAVPLLPKAELGMKLSSALFGVGYILGPKIGTVMVSGGLLSSLVIIPIIAWWGAGTDAPLYPETVKTIGQMSSHELWTRYVRYIGAGAVATAGFITLIRSVPTMLESFRIGARQLRSRRADATVQAPRTSRDLPMRVVFGGVACLVLVMAVVPRVFDDVPSAPARAVAAILVAIFAFFFVTVSSRIVGLVGVTSNPTSGMTIASLLGTASVFLLIGWTDATGMASALTVGCVVAIAASIAGDTSQDLKTGFLLGATPQRQQLGELVGVLTSAVFVCMTLLLLDEAHGLGSAELAAPQATLMKLVIEGVLQAKLPWTLVLIGMGIAVVAEMVRVPALPFAVGVYLPVSTMVPVFLGGLLRYVLSRRAKSPHDKESRRERGVLFGSGLVGGEGLMGVVIAGMVFYQKTGSDDPSASTPLPLEIGTDWISGGGAKVLAIMVFGVLVLYFAKRCGAVPRAQGN